MNIKEFIVPVTFMLLATLALQYYFGGNKLNHEVEHSFVAPKERKEYRPINTEIDFLDKRRSAKTQTTDIETLWGSATFSTDGATLESIDFRHEVDGNVAIIRTIFPVIDTEREQRCFLVALQEKTPFYYTLESFNEKESAFELTYRAETDDVVINKKFVVGKESPKIDLLLDIKPKKDAMLQARIFYPSPVMPHIKEQDVISSVVIDQTNTFLKKNVEQLDKQHGWYSPLLFGSDSRYIIHSLIADADSFAHRAYYKFLGKDQLISVIESSDITQAQSWQLSFYFGPKKLEFLEKIDSRLEQTLDYSGWFAPIARILLKLLQWFYKYLHNYGLAIIALTLLFKIVLLPVTMRGEQRMKQQQEMQKKLTYLQQRYKDDQERLNIERAELIRKHGIPGVGGCLLPMLLQTPIFIALSRVLASAIELYKAPMLWIPDLSAKDPYYIFPLLVFIGMASQARQADAQQRAHLLMMGLILGAFTAYLSAGLALYICVSSLLGTLQTSLMKYFKIVR